MDANVDHITGAEEEATRRRTVLFFFFFFCVCLAGPNMRKIKTYGRRRWRHERLSANVSQTRTKKLICLQRKLWLRGLNQSASDQSGMKRGACFPAATKTQQDSISAGDRSSASTFGDNAVEHVSHIY